ncbi:hypothetical protein [Lysobacter fragariae]
MEIKFGVTDYAPSRLTRFMEREGNVYRRVEAEVVQSAAAAGLFANVDLHWIYVNVSLNRIGPDKKRLPTHCGRTSAWRHLVKQREYVAACDIDLTPWEERSRKKEGLPPLPTAEDLVPPLRRCLSSVVAQVAVALREPARAIADFAVNEGIDLESVNAATAAGVVPRGVDADTGNSGDIRLEISFAETGLTPEAGFARRAAVREIIERGLEENRLGCFDGASSGGGSYDLGFLVSDGPRAVEIAKQGLVDAGYEIGIFSFEIEE